MLALQVLLFSLACADGAAWGARSLRVGLGLLYTSAVLTVFSGVQLARQAAIGLGEARQRESAGEDGD